MGKFDQVFENFNDRARLGVRQGVTVALSASFCHDWLLRVQNCDFSLGLSENYTWPDVSSWNSINAKRGEHVGLDARRASKHHANNFCLHVKVSFVSLESTNLTRNYQKFRCKCHINFYLNELPRVDPERFYDFYISSSPSILIPLISLPSPNLTSLKGDSHCQQLDMPLPHFHYCSSFRRIVKTKV